MERAAIFESVPNFSEGRDDDVIEAIASAAVPAYRLDVDADPDHNRAVVSLAGRRERLVDGLIGAIGSAVERIDLREHRGVHPRVGAADLVGARALARSMRETSAGLRGVQALAFELPGRRVQLSMNLFRVDETGPADVIAELERRGVEMGAEQVVGLCPAIAATPAADG